jgi:TolB-like protein
MVDARTDLFAAADVLFEMLSGKPPFARDTIVSVLHAIVTEQPPALGGSPAIVAVDRVIHRALSKSAGDRYQTADAMAQDLRAALLTTDTGMARTARPMTRLIVLPFRILRADPETDFLAFSLPDAIATCLSGLDSLIVRSSLVASRLADQTADLKTIASEADVDVVLTGTLVRAGEQLRVSTQLVEAPSGTLVWSHTSQLSLGDIFRLQDDLATRIVESLSLPLTAREHRILRHDVPANAKAYEFYLRANQLAGTLSTPSLARDLYLQCLQEDPHYAPAWARLGRVYRVLGKFGAADAAENLSRAEAAFVRALEINPDLSVAHNLYSYLEIDCGRAQDAMVRLVGRAQKRATDPEIFAGLVQACRFCGLLDASLAADEQARRFDRSIGTSVSNTYFHLGDYPRALGAVYGTGVPVSNVQALMMLGRDGEALEMLHKSEAIEVATIRRWCESLRLLLEGRRVEGLAATQTILPDGYRDPESLYFVARQLMFFGSDVNAMVLLERAVEEGFFCVPALARDPWLDSVRSDPAFTTILRRAESRHRDALAAFLEAGGDRLLGSNRSR